MPPMFEVLGKTIHVKSPLTLKDLGTYPIAEKNEIDQWLHEAEVAFEHWRRSRIQDRTKYILGVRDELYRRLEQAIDLISETTGKPRTEALTAEVIPMLDFIAYFVKRAPHILKDRRIFLHLFMHKKSQFIYEPLGPVVILAPWNYPLSIALAEVVLALLAGNTVLLKMSEAALPIGQFIESLFSAVALPKGVLNLVKGNEQTVTTLLASPKIKKIVFTGSTGVGKKILSQSVENLTPCLLELGGKDAAIVRDDANILKAARGIVWGAFTNAGQVCASIQRVYVHRKIIQPFVEAVVSETQKLRLGEDVGAITLPGQLNRYQYQLEAALKAGAKILTGGNSEIKNGAQFFQPTVLINVKEDMAIMKEETFGPFLPIQMVDSDEEAIRYVNDSIYALCASIWTRHIKEAKRMARDIHVGTVTINDVIYTHALPETPWGGYKMTGIGRVHAEIGLKEYVQIKHINYDLIPLTPFWWFPYTKHSYETALALARFLATKPIRKKTRAFFEFVSHYLFKR